MTKATQSLLLNIHFLLQIDITAVIGSFFPALEDVIAWLYRGGRKETNDTIISWCADILKQRRKMTHASGRRENLRKEVLVHFHFIITGEKPVDSLQLMIEAAGGLNGQHRKLTDEEITGNAFVFILAGFVLYRKSFNILRVILLLS